MYFQDEHCDVVLLEVGMGRMEPEQVKDILEAKDRKVAGPTAPAKGLCLMKVDY